MPKKLKSCSSTSNYDTYYKRLRSSKHSISCCNEFFRPTEYTKHLVRFHNFDKSSYCPWCKCEFDRLGGLKANADHLSECFRVMLNKPPLPPPAPTIVCEECRAFDSRKEMLSYYHHPQDRTEEDILTRLITRHTIQKTFWYSMNMFDGPSNYFPFDDASGLGRDVPWAIYTYRYLADKVDRLLWKHVFVKKSAMPTLDAAFKNEQVGLLPFGCMCSGGGEIHCHLIAVGPQKEFDAFWNRVHHVPGTKLKKNGPKSRGSKTIGSVWHLINTIFYVGKRESRCNGRNLSTACGPLRDNHYLLVRPLSPHASMYAYMLIEEGWQRWAKMKLGQSDLIGLDLKKGETRIPLSEMVSSSRHLFLGCRVPLFEGFRECDRLEWLKTDSYERWVLYDPERNPIYFIQDDAAVEEVLGFNDRFLSDNYEFPKNQRVIAHNLIEDRKIQTRMLNDKFLRERQKMRTEISELNAKNAELESEVASLKDQLKTLTWEKRLDRAIGERDLATTKFEMVVDKHETVVRVMEDKYVAVESKNETIETKNQEIIQDKKQIITYLIELVARYQKEIVDYFRMNGDLKTVLANVIEKCLGVTIDGEAASKRKKAG